jgi:hypothetical protein
MNRIQKYILASGITLLIIVILALGVSPSLVFSPTVTVIGTNLTKATSNQISVSAKGDLNAEQMTNIPLRIGKWRGVDYDSQDTLQALGANFVMMRGYEPDTFTQPLFLSVVQSKTDSSFHGPEACFTDQGYEIQETSTDIISVTNQEWSKDNATVTIPCNRLILVKKNSEDKIFERSVVIYFYVKGNQFYSDDITMFEMQGLCPLTGSFEGTLNEEKNFISEVIPIIFSPSENKADESVRPFVVTLAEKGPIGYLCIAAALIVPLGLITYPLLKRRGKIQ